MVSARSERFAKTLHFESPTPAPTLVLAVGAGPPRNPVGTVDIPEFFVSNAR